MQQNPGISDDKLYEDCIEQYNLADLVEVGLAVLPEQTQTQKTAFILEGVFVLQMNYIINVSESPYDQLRHIRDNKLDEAETDTKAKEQRFAPKK